MNTLATAILSIYFDSIPTFIVSRRAAKFIPLPTAIGSRPPVIPSLAIGASLLMRADIRTIFLAIPTLIACVRSCRQSEEQR